MKKFFKKLFSSDSNEPPKEPPLTKYKELEMAWQYFQNEQFEKCIEEASEQIDSTNNKINFEANKLVALGNFRLGNFDLAQKSFVTLSKNSKNSDDWFNLVTSATLNNQIELGKKAFNTALDLYKKNGKRENLSIPNMMFYYMQCLKDISHFELAYEQLNELKKIYSELKITDGTFLHIRGVPFFEHTIDASKDILEKLEQKEVSNWIKSFKDSVDDDGKQYLTDLEQKLINAS